MKMLIACAVLALSVVNSPAAYQSFRVTGLTVKSTPIEIGFNPDGSTIFGSSTYLNLSFTCNLNQRYVIWATEDLSNPTWFPIKNVTPGQDTSVVSQVNGEDVATTPLPMPFMEHFMSGRGFVRVSIADVTPPVANSDWIPVQSMINNGGHITVTFKSEPFREYIIEGSDSPVATNWIPVDLYGSVNDVDSIKIPSQGAMTTVDVLNPMLPWVPVDGGWIRIHRIPIESPAMSFAARGPIVANATTPPNKIWRLVCTRTVDLADRKNTTVQKYIGAKFGQDPLDVLFINLWSTGPDLGAASKYFVITTNGAAGGAKRYFLPSSHPSEYIKIAQTPNYNWWQQYDPASLKVFIALDKYTGDSMPSVVYMPVLNPNDDKKNYLQFHLETREATVIAAATWDQDSILKDGISIKPLGVGLEINTGGGSQSVTLQQSWQFNAMDTELWENYIRAIYPDQF